jgi:hypothetical protein
MGLLLDTARALQVAPALVEQLTAALQQPFATVSAIQGIKNILRTIQQSLSNSNFEVRDELLRAATQALQEMPEYLERVEDLSDSANDRLYNHEIASSGVFGAAALAHGMETMQSVKHTKKRGSDEIAPEHKQQSKRVKVTFVDTVEFEPAERSMSPEVQPKVESKSKKSSVSFNLSVFYSEFC